MESLLASQFIKVGLDEVVMKGKAWRQLAVNQLPICTVDSCLIRRSITEQFQTETQGGDLFQAELIYV
jgi:hypothetical protein